MADQVSVLVEWVESMASELADSFEKTDITIESLKYLMSDDDRLLHQNVQKELKGNFDQLLIECFSSYPDQNDSKFQIAEKLKTPNYNNHFILLRLKSKFQKLKQEQEESKLKLKALESKFWGIQLKIPKLETNDDDDRISISFTRKLKQIMYYYLSNYSFEHVQLKESANSVADSELRVKSVEELFDRTSYLIPQRRAEFLNLEVKGTQLSLIDLVFLDEETEWYKLSMIHSKIIQTGNRLSCHLCDLMFVASKYPNLLEYEKWFFFKVILKIANHSKPKDTKVFKRFSSVILRAEIELKKIKRNNPFDDHEGKIDEVFDMFLGEVLCLESILSYPNLSPMNKTLLKDQLEAVLNGGVEECVKQMDEIRSKVDALKTGFISENAGEEMVMKDFQDTMKLWIDSMWTFLDDDDPNQIMATSLLLEPCADI